MCLAKSHGMGQQQQQRAMLTGVVYAIAAAQLMKMIYVSSAHQATNTADIDSASSLDHDYVSLHFYHLPSSKNNQCVCSCAGPQESRCIVIMLSSLNCNGLAGQVFCAEHNAIQDALVHQLCNPGAKTGRRWIHKVSHWAFIFSCKYKEREAIKSAVVSPQTVLVPCKWPSHCREFQHPTNPNCRKKFDQT